MTLMVLKHVYMVKRSLYIYSTRNFFPYLMWDITNTPHADRMPSLWGQIDKYPFGHRVDYFYTLGNE